MVCGESGIGKSSFAELFMKKFNLREFLDKLEPSAGVAGVAEMETK